MQMAALTTPHVVALAWVSQGHINPLMHFCLKLANNGIHVTFVTIRFRVGNTDIMGQDHKPFHNISFHDLHVELPEDFKVNAPDAWLQVLEKIKNLQGPFEEILHLTSACCVISDSLHTWDHATVQRLGIPRIAFWTASAAALNVDFHIPLLMSHGDIPVTSANEDRVVDYIPGLTPLKARDLPAMYHADDFMTTSDPGYERKIARCALMKYDKCLVVNSFEELECNAFEALKEHVNKRCIGVGPLVPIKFLGLAGGDNEGDHHGVASMFKEDRECLEWLDDNKVPNSVIYISFGTAGSSMLNQHEFDEFSRGLEESEQPFLWAYRQSTGDSTVSLDAFEAFKERTKAKGQGLIISWAPQMEVLSHPSVGAFLTHCGWNSILEAICAGMPMLGLPKYAEQTLNCKLLVDDMKIGISLGDTSCGSSFTHIDVADKVRRILLDEGMKDRVRMLRDLARRSATTTIAPIQELILGIYKYARSIEECEV